MTKKTQQKHLDNLLTELRAGLEDIVDYYQTSEDYTELAKELIHKLDTYENNLKSKS